MFYFRGDYYSEVFVVANFVVVCGMPPLLTSRISPSIPSLSLFPHSCCHSLRRAGSHALNPIEVLRALTSCFPALHKMDPLRQKPHPPGLRPHPRNRHHLRREYPLRPRSLETLRLLASQKRDLLLHFKGWVYLEPEPADFAGTRGSEGESVGGDC